MTYSDEAKQIAGSMDPNASLELTLLTMQCHSQQIALSQLWIEACYYHINTVVLPRLKAKGYETSIHE